MPSSRNKFHAITFPFFGLYKLPCQIRYQGDVINIVKSGETKFSILDDINFSGPYIERLLKLEQKFSDTRVKFDVTASNMQQLVSCNPRIVWGIDSLAKIYNLSTKQRFSYYCSKIFRNKDTLFWIRGISYPFQLPKYLRVVDLKNIVVHLVYINNTWEIYKFDYQYNKKKTIML